MRYDLAENFTHSLVTSRNSMNELIDKYHLAPFVMCMRLKKCYEHKAPEERGNKYGLSASIVWRTDWTACERENCTKCQKRMRGKTAWWDYSGSVYMTEKYGQQASRVNWSVSVRKWGPLAGYDRAENKPMWTIGPWVTFTRSDVSTESWLKISQRARDLEMRKWREGWYCGYEVLHECSDPGCVVNRDPTDH